MSGYYIYIYIDILLWISHDHPVVGLYFVFNLVQWQSSTSEKNVTVIAHMHVIGLIMIMRRKHCLSNIDYSGIPTYRVPMFECLKKQGDTLVAGAVLKAYIAWKWLSSSSWQHLVAM